MNQRAESLQSVSTQPNWLIYLSRSLFFLQAVRLGKSPMHAKLQFNLHTGMA